MGLYRTAYTVDNVRHVACWRCLPALAWRLAMIKAGRLIMLGPVLPPCEYCGGL
jgi:hypothetical protein